MIINIDPVIDNPFQTLSEIVTGFLIRMEIVGIKAKREIISPMPKPSAIIIIKVYKKLLRTDIPNTDIITAPGQGMSPIEITSP